MAYSHLKIMDYTVDMKDESPHDVNQIAATIAGTTKTGDPFHITRTNFFPEPIVTKIGKDVKIGSASGSTHAETGILLEIMITNGLSSKEASLYVTDPTCPNCAKNTVEAGIRNVFIDSEGFEADYYQRRKDDFENMSLAIYEHAGVNVHIVDRAAQTVALMPGTSVRSIKAAFSKISIAAYEEELSPEKFKKYIHEYWGNGARDARNVFALAASHEAASGYVILSSGPEFVKGHDEAKDGAYVSDKYSYKLEPANKVMMTMARLGLTQHREFFFSSQALTSREFVDMIGAGYRRIFIGDMRKARDEYGLQALKQIQEHQILEIQSL